MTRRLSPSPRLHGVGWLCVVAAAAMLLVLALSLRWYVEFGGRRWWITLAGARVNTGWYHASDPRTRSALGWSAGRAEPDTYPWHFQVPRFQTGGPFGFANVPLWVPVTVVAVPGAILLHRARRRPAGLCPRCGYDLSGSPSGACPECGHAQNI